MQQEGLRTFYLTWARWEWSHRSQILHYYKRVKFCTISFSVLRSCLLNRCLLSSKGSSMHIWAHWGHLKAGSFIKILCNFITYMVQGERILIKVSFTYDVRQKSLLLVTSIFRIWPWMLETRLSQVVPIALVLQLILQYKLMNIFSIICYIINLKIDVAKNRTFSEI